MLFITLSGASYDETHRAEPVMTCGGIMEAAPAKSPELFLLSFDMHISHMNVQFYILIKTDPFTL